MQRTAPTSLFLTELSPLKSLEPKNQIGYGRFYQQFISIITRGLTGRQALYACLHHLIKIADQSYLLRDMVTLQDVSRAILRLPIPESESIGQYYGAIFSGRRGEIQQAQSLLTGVAANAPLRFRARAMNSLGAYSFDQRDLRTARSFYLDAGRIAEHTDRFDPLVAFTVQRMTAVMRSEHGDHRSALDDLEKIFPLARLAARTYPALLPDYLNSYAVELAAVGRVEEARNVSDIVIASPYAAAYPEWRETREEIAAKERRRSHDRIAFNWSTAQPANVVRLDYSERRTASVTSPASQPSRKARVVDFQQWTKTHMSTQPTKREFKRLSTEELREMTPGQKRARLLKLIYDLQPDDDELRKMIAAIEDVLFDERAQG